MQKISLAKHIIPGIGLILIIAIIGFSIAIQLSERSGGDLLVIDRVWSEYKKTTVYLQDQKIEAVIADTEEKRIQGLSDTEYLLEDTGMLFLFDEPAGIHPFWMKDMQYDLDILWLDIDGEIVHRVESVTPASYPDTFTNTTPARYVLELPAGTCKKYTCTMGDTLYFSLE